MHSFAVPGTPSGPAGGDLFDEVRLQRDAGAEACKAIELELDAFGAVIRSFVLVTSFVPLG